jgi:hypothetical protein
LAFALLFSYQALDRLTIQTTDSATGTSLSTPTTLATAAPDWKPTRKLNAPRIADRVGKSTTSSFPFFVGILAYNSEATTD